MSQSVAEKPTTAWQVDSHPVQTQYTRVTCQSKLNPWYFF